MLVRLLSTQYDRSLCSSNCSSCETVQVQATVVPLDIILILEIDATKSGMRNVTKSCLTNSHQEKSIFLCLLVKPSLKLVARSCSEFKRLNKAFPKPNHDKILFELAAIFSSRYFYLGVNIPLFVIYVLSRRGA